MSEVVFSCPHCGGAVQCDSQYAGQTLSCPHCQGGIIAPEASPEISDSDSAKAASDEQSPEVSDQGAEASDQSSVISDQEAEVSDQGEEVSDEEPALEPEVVPAPRTETDHSPATQRIPKPKGRPVEAKEGDLLITFDCPGCGEELEIPESAIGNPVGCPDCGREVTNDVPRPAPSTGKKKIVMKKKGVKPMG